MGGKVFFSFNNASSTCEKGTDSFLFFAIQPSS
jgi:hypothetical protein